MRLDKLELQLFGPFVGQSLTFRRNAKLHIVYGRNEAGKSCALAAVTDLFFGIQRQTRYDFLHEQRELRIGAIIADRAGQPLKFRRRKGNKSTLLDFDTNTALPEDILVRFIGSITRDVFCNAFGLNAQTLRSGAEEMLKSEGEVGASLFAAASGLRGLTQLREQLDAEANAIFAPRASKERAFYQSLERFTSAGRAIRERELKAGHWKELNEKIDRLAGELESIKQKRQDNGAEHARLSRLRRVGPQIAQIDADLGALAALGSLPDVEPGFSEKLDARLAARDAARQTRDRTSQDEQQAGANLAAITFDAAPLTRAAEITQLFAELGAYTKAGADIPAVEREVHLYSGQLNEYATRLGLPDGQTMERARPSDAALALARTLIADGGRLQTAISNNAAEVAEEQGKLEQLEHEAQLRAKAVDPKPFADRLTVLAPALRQLDRYGELAANHAKLTRQLEEGVSRLKPALSASIDIVAASKLPSSETIARVRRSLDTIDKERERAVDRVSENATAIRGHEQRLKAFGTERPVPTREAISAQRGRRDSIWHGLRSTLLGEADPLPAVSVPQTVREFEHNAADADRLSDDALIDASRVAEFASIERQLAEARSAQAELQETAADLERRRSEEWAAYVEQWSRTGLGDPLPPAEMIVWLASLGKLLEKREEVQDAKAKLDTVNTAVDAAAPQLARLAHEVGLDEAADLEPSALAPRLELRLREMSDARSQRRDFETSLRTANDRVAKLLRQKLQLEEKYGEWQAQWRSAVAAISVSGATIEQAQAALEVWQAVPAASSARDDRAGRVTGMRIDMAAFAEKIAVVVAAIAPNLEAMAPEIALKQLNERLSESTKASTRHGEAAKHVAEAVRRKEKAELAFSEAESLLGQLVKRLPNDADLQDLCRRLKTRDNLLQSLAKLRNQLLAQADGLAEDELRSQLADFDPDLAIGKLKNLELENEQLDRGANEAFAAHREALKERQTQEQGGGAELAALQKRGAEAELVACAREWSVLRLGTLLLSAAIERQRTNQQDPLMVRAGHLFATITGGAFSGVGQEFDENDVLRLVGQRPTGEDVHVEGMSEGARDQLYLALRLAYLEDYAKRSEPIPFLGDDLFMTFDDTRTKNGLVALAALSQDVQPILFTHHRHVVELAQQALGGEVDVMELDSTVRVVRQTDPVAAVA
jgi:uncharacterized protein YhaN